MMKLSDDNRKITIKFRVNDEENKLLEEKFLMSLLSVFSDGLPCRQVPVSVETI